MIEMIEMIETEQKIKAFQLSTQEIMEGLSKKKNFNWKYLPV